MRLAPVVCALAFGCTAATAPDAPAPDPAADVALERARALAAVEPELAAALAAPGLGTSLSTDDGFAVLGARASEPVVIGATDVRLEGAAPSTVEIVDGVAV